jgi:hypothetical protein
MVALHGAAAADLEIAAPEHGAPGHELVEVWKWPTAAGFATGRSKDGTRLDLGGRSDRWVWARRPAAVFRYI